MTSKGHGLCGPGDVLATVPGVEGVPPGVLAGCSGLPRALWQDAGRGEVKVPLCVLAKGGGLGFVVEAQPSPLK